MVNKYPNIADTLGIIAVAAATCKAQPDMAIEAVQYVDGDSGILVAELFQDCLKAYKKSSTLQRDDFHGYTLVPFRERFHDAPELGHKYTIKIYKENLERPEIIEGEFGHSALVMSRLRLQDSVQVFVVVHEADSSGHRLLVDILTRAGEGEILQSNATYLATKGLTHLVEGSPIKKHAGVTDNLQKYSKRTGLGDHGQF